MQHRIAVLGANGHIGSRLVQEALNRGHHVTAIVRDPAKLTVQHPNLTVVQADALNPATLTEPLAGHDALISAYNAGFTPDADQTDFSRAARNMLTAVQQTGVPRLLWVGGAGSLEVAPGVRLFDVPEFPEAYKVHARAQGDVLNLFRTEADVDWTYISPAADIQPGTRTGQYRVGGDQLLTDEAGNSHISTEDYAVALIDEIEQSRHVRQRFTVAY